MRARDKATEAAELLLDGETEALTRKAVEPALEGEGPARRELEEANAALV